MGEFFAANRSPVSELCDGIKRKYASSGFKSVKIKEELGRNSSPKSCQTSRITIDCRIVTLTALKIILRRSSAQKIAAYSGGNSFKRIVPDLSSFRFAVNSHLNLDNSKSSIPIGSCRPAEKSCI